MKRKGTAWKFKEISQSCRRFVEESWERNLHMSKLTKMRRELLISYSKNWALISKECYHKTGMCSMLWNGKIFLGVLICSQKEIVIFCLLGSKDNCFLCFAFLLALWLLKKKWVFSPIRVEICLLLCYFSCICSESLLSLWFGFIATLWSFFWMLKMLKKNFMVPERHLSG